MGIFKAAAQTNRSDKLSGGMTYTQSSTAVSSLFGSGGSAIDVLQEYNGYAWKMINIRATTFSSEDIFIERHRGDKWDVDTDHEFMDVIGGDGSTRDYTELAEAYIRSLDLYGEAFLYFSMGQRYNKPFAVYLLDPAAMTVLVKNERVAGYIYQKGGVRAVFEPGELLHRKIEDPRSPFRGYGPMQAAGWFIREARYTTTYVNNFLENNAIPAGVIVAKNDTNDDDWTLFKDQWREKYGGVENSGKTGFLRTDQLEFVKTGLSIADVDFDKMKKATRDDVMLMFGVSKPMAAIFDDINRASSQTAQELFALTFAKPELKALTRKLTRLVKNWYGKEYRVGFTDPTPDDDEVKLALYDKGVGRWFTVNEARAAFGREPISGGDEINPETKSTRTTVSTEKHAEGGATRVFLADKPTRVVLKKATDTKREYWEATDNLAAETEKRLYEVLSPILEEQLKTQIDDLEPKKSVFKGFDKTAEAGKVAEAALGVLISLAELQGKLGIEFTGSDKEFSLTNEIRAYIENSIREAAISFTSDTAEYVAKAIADGLEAGEGVPKLVKRLEAIYRDVTGIDNPGYRLQRLARTETIKASNEAAELSYKQSSVVSRKEWYNNPGACDECRGLNGTTAPLDGEFDGGVAHPTLHPNCRCTVLPVIDETI